MIDRNSAPELIFKEALTYWTGFVGEHFLRLRTFSRLRSRAERRILARGLPEAGILPVPKIDPRSIDPLVFRKQYVQGYTPVVLKGVGAAWPAIQKWTPEFFKTNYGNETVCVRVKAAGVGPESVYTRDIRMADFIDNILSGGEYYASNVEDLFNTNPELRNDLPLRALEAYSCAERQRSAPARKRRWRIPNWGEILSTQIFISNSKGRTGYHCASGGNFFLQVYGRKRWLFVNPRHTAFMYPVIRKDLFYSASALDARLSSQDLARQGYPLYNLIPKYEAVLEAGDVLYSPQWWWHTVDNLSDSIGVALRFRTDVFANNPLYSIMAMFSPDLLRALYEIVRTGWSADTVTVRRLFEPEGKALDIRVSRGQRAQPANQSEAHVDATSSR